MTAVVATKPAAAETETSDERNPTAAVLLSAAPSAAATAVLVAGLVGDGDNSGQLVLAGVGGLMIAPAVGHWYGAGTPWTAGAAIRGVGLGLMATGVVVAVADATSSIAGGEKEQNAGTVGVLFYGGIAALGVGAVYDIATAYGATEAANERRTHSLRIAPTMVSTSTGHAAMGLRLSGSF